MKKLFALFLLGFMQLGYAATDPRLEQIQALRLAGDYSAAIERVQTELAAEPANSLLLTKPLAVAADSRREAWTPRPLASGKCSSWPAQSG